MLMQTQPADIARAELVACLHRIARRDRAALEQLYKSTSAKLFGICRRILPDERAAEDVLQEVYLIVWNKAGQFDAELGLSPVTWLAAIARNRSLDRLRAGKRRFAALEAAAELPDPAPLSDARLETAENHHRLAECLQGLDARAAEAIRAAFFGGLTYQRLAERAGLPLATMKSIIRRGLGRLRDCLEAPQP
jgi:RNA polymerase sigma-70 factor (ECF subfamily)